MVTNIHGEKDGSSENATQMQLFKLNAVKPSDLGPQTTFILYDLELTEQERAQLDLLRIQMVSHYENYGDLQFLGNEVRQFIMGIGKNDPMTAGAVADAVERIVNNVIQFTGLETAWVTLRAFPPIAAFKRPRWHADRYDYPPTGEQLKGAVTLKGPSTVFYNATPEHRADLENIKTDRDQLVKVLQPSLFVSAAPGQGAIFTIGATHAPFHTEPDITDERLFLAIVPGTKVQIKAVYDQTPEQLIIPSLRKNGFYCYFLGPRVQTEFVASPYGDTEFIVFKLPEQTDYNPEDHFTSISKIVTDNIPEMRTEIVNDGNRKLLKCIFSHGGAIAIIDISAFIKENEFKVETDDDLYNVLDTYAKSLVKASYSQAPIPEMSACESDSINLATIPGYFSVNRITGRNTAGLFKPVAATPPAIKETPIP